MTQKLYKSFVGCIIIQDMFHEISSVLQVSELQIDANDVVETAEEDDEDAVEKFEPVNEETDEDYVPAEELSSLSASALSVWKCRAQLKTDKCENSKAMGGESKKDSVQCPICDKSFKSKYYLKVHNRYKQVEAEAIKL